MNHTLIDEKKLLLLGTLGHGRFAQVAVKGQDGVMLRNFQQALGEVFAEKELKPFGERFIFEAKNFFAIADKRKSNIGMNQGLGLNGFIDVFEFGGVGFKKFASCWNVEKRLRTLTEVPSAACVGAVS